MVDDTACATGHCQSRNRNAASRKAEPSQGVAHGHAHERYAHPPPDVVTLGQPRPGRKRRLLLRPLVAHARPLDGDLAALVAGGSGRRAPPVAGLAGAASVARAGKGLRILLEHPRDGRHARGKAELLEAAEHIVQTIFRLMLELPRQRAVNGGTSLPGVVPRRWRVLCVVMTSFPFCFRTLGAYGPRETTSPSFLDFNIDRDIPGGTGTGRQVRSAPNSRRLTDMSQSR